MSQEAKHWCEACDRRVVAVTPHWRWRAARLAVFPVLALFLVGMSALLILGSGILVLAVGAMIVGPLNEQASADPTCPACRRVVVRATAAPRLRAAQTVSSRA